MSIGFPTPTIRLHLASIDFTPMKFVTDGHRRRANAILLRRTDRLPFAEPPDWDALNRSCAVRLLPTRYASTPSPTICVRSWRKRLSSPSRFASTIRRITPNSNGGQQHSRSRRYSTQLARVGGRERPRRRRTQLPGHPSRERRPEVDEDHSKIPVLSTYDNDGLACCTAVKCSPPCCSTPRWSGWRRAR